MIRAFICVGYREKLWNIENDDSFQVLIVKNFQLCTYMFSESHGVWNFKLKVIESIGMM